MVMDWQTAVALLSALSGVVGWHCCQAWQLNRTASYDRTLPPRLRATSVGNFRYGFQATSWLTRGHA
jgi:hypothetical protein